MVEKATAPGSAGAVCPVTLDEWGVMLRFSIPDPSSGIAWAYDTLAG